MSDTKTDSPNRATAGKLSYDLLTKVSDTTNPIEQMRENLSDYEKNMYECYETGKKTFDGCFYIVVITKKERLMPNVLRNYFLSRKSCPTPDYDQAVYRYDRKEDSLKFMWVVPSKDTCLYLKANALTVSNEDRGLLRNVLEFSDGLLLEQAKKRNGEVKDSSLLEK